MKTYSLTHLSNEALDRELPAKAAREKGATAELLATIAEFDERKRFLPAAYESMLAYCIGELGLSRDEAKQRIHIARAGRTCPRVFEVLEQGRIHLTGLRLLAPHLTPENADDLLSAAIHKSKEDIEQLLAARTPRLDVPAMVAPVAVEGAPEHLGNADLQEVRGAPAAAVRPRACVAPLSAEAFAVQFTRSRKADERFRYLQSLLGHQVSRGDLAEVYARAVEALVAKMERVRFGACDKPRKGGSQASTDPRYVSAETKRTVWKRDGGQCTYVSESGHRCEATGDVQFDHVVEVARGGQSTVDNIRLRCLGHNQHTAEKTFGAGFMAEKRKEAAEARTRAKAERARIREEKAEANRLQPHEEEVVPWICALGIREHEARIAARRCGDMADARLEDRVKRALSFFGARISRTISPVPAVANTGGIPTMG